ncbi:MAG: hypothetical protein K6G85_07445 [Eubacterium sp.]|nr:hypothetical protein [Eubacterium sp.]
MNRLYQMPKEKAQQLLNLAKEQVPLGVYAIEKNKILELRNDKCGSVTQLKTMKRQLKKAGYKVYANGVD